MTKKAYEKPTLARRGMLSAVTAGPPVSVIVLPE
jgi:hypothetical protein